MRETAKEVFVEKFRAFANREALAYLGSPVTFV